MKKRATFSVETTDNHGNNQMNSIKRVPNSFAVVLTSFFIAQLLNNAVIAQERGNTLSLEQERQAALEEFDVTEVPDLDAVRSFASQLFSQPIEQQNAEQLKKLSKEANRAANLVDYIYDEYDDYYRDNYKYEFVQKLLVAPVREYRNVFNEFVDIRNQAYFNLGVLSRNNGKTMEAFLYFKDVFRLSSFDCGSKTETKSCMRWKAEQELQKLLGLTHIEAYVSWQQ